MKMPDAMHVLGTMFVFHCCDNLNADFKNIFTKMRIENDRLSIKTICKSLDMNFISIKKYMKWNCGKFSIFR